MLNRLALRLATVRALRGRTLAGHNVFDSMQAAIDDVAVEHPTPVMLVYTDDGQWAIFDRNLYSTSGNGRVGSGEQRLIIEMAVTQRMVVPQYDPETGQPMFSEDGQLLVNEQAVPLVTDANLEATLDILERQVLVALMDGESHPWTDMWKQFAVSIAERTSDRGASARDGVRFAGRQLTLSINLAAEPIPGPRLPGSTWHNFMILAATDASLRPLLPTIEAALAGTPPVDAAAELRQILGISDGESASLGYEAIGGAFAPDGLTVADDVVPARP